jgi:hypothetical protein
VIESKKEIGAYGQNLRVRFREFADTRLVGGEFAGSTTGECGREEREHNILLAAKIRKLHGLVVGVWKSKIGSFVADFQVSLGRCRWLREQRGCGQCREKK